MELTFQWEDGQSAITTLTKEMAAGLGKVTHAMETHRKQSGRNGVVGTER